MTAEEVAPEEAADWPWPPGQGWGSIEDVAARFGVPPPVVRAWMGEGRLTGYQPRGTHGSRMIRFNLREVEAAAAGLKSTEPESTVEEDPGPPPGGTFTGQYGHVQYGRVTAQPQEWRVARYERFGCELGGGDRRHRYPPALDVYPGMVFDHCHRHGWVRGVLCIGCNVLAGRLDGALRDLARFGGVADLGQGAWGRYIANCPGCAGVLPVIAAPDAVAEGIAGPPKPKPATVPGSLTGGRQRRSWGKIRRLRSGTYQASYLNRTGRRCLAPTPFRTKGAAEAWLDQKRDAEEAAS